jgi:hypothetical protein
MWKRVSGRKRQADGRTGPNLWWPYRAERPTADGSATGGAGVTWTTIRLPGHPEALMLIRLSSAMPRCLWLFIETP